MIKSRISKWLKKASEQIELRGDVIEELRLLGPMLLEQVTDQYAVALTRAAIVDATESGTLAALLNEQNNAITLLIRELVETGMRRNTLSVADPEVVTKSYSDILFGNVQLQCALGVQDPPDAADREAHAALACTVLARVYG